MTKSRLPWIVALVLTTLVAVQSDLGGQVAMDSLPSGPGDDYAAAPMGTLEGLVTPSRRNVLIAPLEGQLATIDVEEGDVVEAGHVLAKMDDRLQQLVVESARLQAESTAEVQQAQLQLEEARVQLDRVSEARDRNAAAEWEVRRAGLQVRAAEFGVAAAEDKRKLAASNLKLEQERLSRYTLKAPFAGRVIRVVAEEGATLSRGDEILALASLNPLEAHLYLPVTMYGKLKVGQTYRLTAASPVNAELVGTLKAVDPLIDSASQTFRCKFEIANPDDKLPAGFPIALVWPQ